MASAEGSVMFQIATRHFDSSKDFIDPPEYDSLERAVSTAHEIRLFNRTNGRLVGVKELHVVDGQGSIFYTLDIPHEHVK